MKRTCHRRYIEEEELNEELRKYLPREDGKAVEKPCRGCTTHKDVRILPYIYAPSRTLQPILSSAEWCL